MVASRELHNEIFKMIKYAVEEMISAGDQAARLLEFWTSIVERLFGLPPRDAQARPLAMPQGLCLGSPAC